MALVVVHCIHFLTIVPMQEGIATEHGCEVLSHTLERLLSRSAVDSQYRCRSLCCGGQEASCTLESLFAYTTPAMENFVAVVSDRLLGVTIQYRLRYRARRQTSPSR